MVSPQPPCALELKNIHGDDWPPNCHLCGDSSNCWKEEGKLDYIRKYFDDIRKKTLQYGREAEPLAMMHALLAKTKGEDVTLEDVHDAWSLWMSVIRENPDHPSNIPFDQLETWVQDMDEPFAEAIREVARENGNS